MNILNRIIKLIPILLVLISLGCISAEQPDKWNDGINGIKIGCCNIGNYTCIRDMVTEHYGNISNIPDNATISIYIWTSCDKKGNECCFYEMGRKIKLK